MLDTKQVPDYTELICIRSANISTAKMLNSFVDMLSCGYGFHVDERDGHSFDKEHVLWNWDYACFCLWWFIDPVLVWAIKEHPLSSQVHTEPGMTVCSLVLSLSSFFHIVLFFRSTVCSGPWLLPSLCLPISSCLVLMLSSLTTYFPSSGPANNAMSCSQVSAHQVGTCHPRDKTPRSGMEFVIGPFGKDIPITSP